jgi:hypothetical protein
MRAIHTASKIPGFDAGFSDRYFDLNRATIIVSYESLTYMK